MRPRSPAAPVTPARENSTGWGQVSGTAVNVRSGPGLDHAVLSTLKGGEFVKLGATNGNWIEIEWPQNVSVWIAKESVQASREKGGPVTAKAGALVRASGSRKAESFGAIESGTKLTVLSEAEGWLKIKAPASLHAFISSKYVTLNVRKPVVTVKNPDAPAGKSVEAMINEAPPASTKLAKADPIEQIVAPHLSEAKKMEDADRAAADTKKKIEADEAARKIAEAKRLEEVETARREAEAKHLAEIDETRRQKELSEKQEQFWKAAEARRQDELARAETARLEAQEQARQVAETKRLEESARVEAQKKVALAEQAAKEEQARAVAEAKRLEDVARAEAQKRAALEEQARVEAETKRIAEAKAAELKVAEAKAAEKKAAESKAAELKLAEKKAAEVAKSAPIIEDEPDAFVKPTLKRAGKGSGAVNLEPAATVVTLSSLPEPSAAAAVYTPAARPKQTVTIDPGVETTKADRTKFVLPNRAPKKPGNRAEVIDFTNDDAKPDSKDVKTASQAETSSFVQPPATLVFPVRSAEKPAPEAKKESQADPNAPEILPTPTGDAPISLRLPSYHETRIDPTETNAQVTTAEGTLERRTAHPFENAAYALVRSGVTLYYLTARPNVNLDVMVGQKVRISGVAMSNRSNAAILEVATISSQE
jgi:uncharacterized protein YgiM (DUF1202 family)